VSVAEEVDDLVAAVEDGLGPIDGYVHMVAIRVHEPFEQITTASWDRVIRTNLTSGFELARRIVPGMCERGWGRVLHVSGGEGSIGAKSRAHHVAAKAGLHGLTKALAREVAARGVTVNTMGLGPFATSRDPAQFPDWDETGMIGQVPVARLGDPAEVGALSAFLMSDEAAFITGQVVHMNGGRLMF
jgi:NAD(P)-dependent dehydrogenase (short-subunit alcohol dehydrogenase family)